MAASSTARQNRPQGITLIQAAEAGDSGSVEALIAAGVNVNSVTEHGMTALMSAAANGHLGLVSRLLERGADINAKRRDGLDALALAVFFGHVYVVHELLGRGADLRAESRFGTSPDMWATSRGFHDIAQILTETKAARSLATPEDLARESNAVSADLDGAQGPIVDEAFSSSERLSEETEPSKIQVPRLPDAMFEDGWNMASLDASELTVEVSPASVWNAADDMQSRDHLPAGDTRTNAGSVVAEVTNKLADKVAPPRRPRALPVEQQPYPIISSYVAKPRYHHKRKSRKLVKCLAYITSDWQRLTVTTLIVMLISGLVTFAFLKLLSPSKPSWGAKPADVAAPPALQDFTAQNDLRTTTQREEIPATPLATNSASDEKSVSPAKKRDDRRGPKVDRIEHPSTLRVAERPLRKSAERVTGARPKQAVTPKRETRAGSPTTPSFRSASVSAKKISSRNAADLALEANSAKAPTHAPPVPLSIERQRPRSVAAKNDSPKPAATPGRNTKGKVIQWP